MFHNNRFNRRSQIRQPPLFIVHTTLRLLKFPGLMNFGTLDYKIELKFKGPVVSLVIYASIEAELDSYCW